MDLFFDLLGNKCAKYQLNFLMHVWNNIYPEPMCMSFIQNPNEHYSHFTLCAAAQRDTGTATLVLFCSDDAKTS